MCGRCSTDAGCKTSELSKTVLFCGGSRHGASGDVLLAKCGNDAAMFKSSVNSIKKSRSLVSVASLRAIDPKRRRNLTPI